MVEIFDKDKRSLIILLVLISVLLNVLPAFCADKEGETGLFESAYGSYFQYQPDKAAALFEKFLKDYPKSSAQDAALYWYSKALLQLNRKEEARMRLSELVERFPLSPLSSYAKRDIEQLGEPVGPAVTPDATVKDKGEKTKDLSVQTSSQGGWTSSVAANKSQGQNAKLVPAAKAETEKQAGGMAWTSVYATTNAEQTRKEKVGPKEKEAATQLPAGKGAAKESIGASVKLNKPDQAKPEASAIQKKTAKKSAKPVKSKKKAAKKKPAKKTAKNTKGNKAD